MRVGPPYTAGIPVGAGRIPTTPIRKPVLDMEKVVATETPEEIAEIRGAIRQLWEEVRQIDARIHEEQQDIHRLRAAAKLEELKRMRAAN